MTQTLAPNVELLDRVAELRTRGRSPKEIARALGIRPTDATDLIRSCARIRAAERAERAEPDLAGCWVSPGWSSGLSVPERPDWPDWHNDERLGGGNGLALVAAARRPRPHRLSVVAFLVDTYCLGVKDAVPPRSISDGDLPSFLAATFRCFEDLDGPPPQAPLSLAREIVFGAIEYARGLGFEPHDDFAAAAGHLGAPWSGPGAITFGNEGKPLYINGPYDDAPGVLATLNRTVGAGNFHYVMRVG